MPETEAQRLPRGALDIARVFNRMALQGFGGVLAVNKVSFDVRRGEVFTPTVVKV